MPRPRSARKKAGGPAAYSTRQGVKPHFASVLLADFATARLTWSSGPKKSLPHRVQAIDLLTKGSARFLSLFVLNLPASLKADQRK